MKELKSLVGFGLACAELVADLADGVSFSLISKVVQVAKEAKPAFKGAEVAFEQYVGMTDEAALEIEQWVVSEFDIDNEKVELAIESALKAIIQLRVIVELLVPKKQIA